MAAIIFVFGLILGSFLNAVIYRLYDGKSISSGRSQCPHCNHNLSASDLVPILSYIWLKGKCRYCGKKISWQYPAVELLTATALVLLSRNFQEPASTAAFWFQAAFICFFIIIAVFDLKHYLILDKVVFPASALAFFYLLVIGYEQQRGFISLSSPLVQGLIGVAIISGFFGLQYLISKGKWIGLGDVKLGIFLGLLFGLGSSLMLLLVSYCLGAAVGLVLIAVGKRQLSGKLPFGTFLGFSGIIILIYGNSLIHWYLGLLQI